VERFSLLHQEFQEPLPIPLIGDVMTGSTLFPRPTPRACPGSPPHPPLCNVSRRQPYSTPAATRSPNVSRCFLLVTVTFPCFPLPFPPRVGKQKVSRFPFPLFLPARLRLFPADGCQPCFPLLLTEYLPPFLPPPQTRLDAFPSFDVGHASKSPLRPGFSSNEKRSTSRSDS